MHRQFLLGRHHARQSNRGRTEKAVQYLRRRDRQRSCQCPAHAGLAEAYTGLAGFYCRAGSHAESEARSRNRVTLDDSLADAHAALGTSISSTTGTGRRRRIAPARARSQSHACDVRLNYAAYLTTQGRHDEADPEIRRAVDLDPVSIRTHAFGTLLLIFTRRYDEAIELARKGLELEPISAFTLAFQGVA